MAVVVVIVIIIILAIRLVLATPHSNIAPDADTATLFGNHATQSSALGETGELLRTEDSERNRLDLEPVGDVRTLLDLCVLWCLAIHVLVFLQFFIQRETQPVFAFVTNRQVREDEVACRSRPVEVGHASNRSAGQNGKGGLGGWRDAALGEMAGVFEGCEEEEIGIVREGDVGFGICAFEDA